MSKTKYIFITGGVVSSLGKGIASASLGALLQARGYNVRLRKLDPYLNIDPGTMNPIQHGEVFVTDDGAETDLDLGHYERFTNVSARKSDSVTSGRIYSNLLAKERRGDYLGATVQVIPHVTNLIKEFITADVIGVDFLICEIGGTVGDIEALPFFEAIRQLGNELGEENTLYLHLTLVPYISAAKELKTKPTQHSVKELRSIGIQPDILLCRTEYPISQSDKQKIALFCNLKPERVIEARDIDSIYKVPTEYHKEGLDVQILKKFGLDFESKPNLAIWEEISEKISNPKDGEVCVAIVGKYTALADSYKSIMEALCHAGIANDVKVKVKWVNSRLFNDDNIAKEFEGVDAILVPGAFGNEGSEGKISSIKYARENKIPYFGICFGMQMAVIETARNVANIKDATSSEFTPAKDPLVGLMKEWQKGDEKETRSIGGNLGGTMRLGAYDCVIKEGSLAHKIYQSTEISERHRHRYEVNINYKEKLEACGMVFSGLSPDGKLPEIIELKNHPFFIAVQFHPELKSRPFAPHPIFKEFIKAAKK
ncbi:MAG: CTP synthase [Rickettsiales bacterium]|nr:CTP synthase [Rickettsiales bacterium]